MSQTTAGQLRNSSGTGPMKFIYSTGARPLDGYTIKRGVGVGGFGEVYFATSDAGKEVALKRIQRNLDVEIRGVTHCLNLKHLNLISIFDIKYDDQGEAWIIMEFVAGESLKDVIDRNPNGMPRDEVDSWFSSICAGVAYLHDHGIVHRDLKPGNIFIDEGIVKIGDYGLSKFISCSRRSGQTESVGTFHYMAPEIGKGVYGKEIDIYALGIILFEMLTGRVPFDGESSQEIIMKHLTAEPDLSGIPPRYQQVIQRALFKDPAQRPARVEQMVKLLDLPEAASTFRPPVVAQPRSADQVTVQPMFIDDQGIARDEMVFGPVVEAAGTSTEKPPVVAEAVDSGAARREPIAAAVGAGYGRVVNWWNTAELSTPLKVAIMIGVIAVLLLSSGWLLPVGSVLFVTYLVYLGIRAIVVGADGSTARPVSTGAPRGRVTPVATPRHDARHRHRHRPRRVRVPWQQKAREVLQQKPVSQRLTELIGSWLMATVVASVLSLLILMLGGHSLDASVETWTFYAWLTVSSVLGSWLVLGLSKLWEGREGDAVLRRFVMLVAGLMIGLGACLMADVLMVRLAGREIANVIGMPNDFVPSGMYAADGTPFLTAFLAYFAALFLVLRWWRQADPLRKTRFSLWATIVCMFWAVVIPWQIPWGLLLAATISVAVQLSAPWMPSAERTRIRREALEV